MYRLPSPSISFQSALPVWGATLITSTTIRGQCVSIRAPRVGSDETRTAISCAIQRFNPRSPCGERPARLPARGGLRWFQSALPVWGATRSRRSRIWGFVVSIRAPRVGSDEREARLSARISVSIRAPRVGSDEKPECVSSAIGGFNPRSPCGERQERDELRAILESFQSALPVWGATCPLPHGHYLPLFQSALPVWGATHRHVPLPRRVRVSIRAPRVGSDSERGMPSHPGVVSIRAPRVGSDCAREQQAGADRGFNPRSPCGERRHRHVAFVSPWPFQSALPVWGATKRIFRYDTRARFNPRSPCGERHIF